MYYAHDAYVSQSTDKKLGHKISSICFLAVFLRKKRQHEAQTTFALHQTYARSIQRKTCVRTFPSKIRDCESRWGCEHFSHALQKYETKDMKCRKPNKAERKTGSGVPSSDIIRSVYYVNIPKYYAENPIYHVGKTEYYVGGPKFYVSNSKYYVGFLKVIVKKSMINTDVSTSADSLRLSSEDETKERPVRRNSLERPQQCIPGSAEYLFPKTIVCTAHSKSVLIRPPNFIFHQNMFCKHRLFRQKV